MRRNRSGVRGRQYLSGGESGAPLRRLYRPHSQLVVRERATAIFVKTALRVSALPRLNWSVPVSLRTARRNSPPVQTTKKTGITFFRLLPFAGFQGWVACLVPLR